ncbi:MAG: hypothetical protein DCF17_11670 [Shackletoniella antarctica]|jgi:hypothetical protein|uniref:DUF5615 domain-containing protein n=1 Tax=Shackletoniella antarctica TaxID=268115 RepID=A0A2W4W694_9CYAN|nr:MAG: hypothetical protein DCF17_11670 [Shackletoniella antarctica]
MSKIQLYIDEDAMDLALVEALRARDVDVVTVNEASTCGYLDEQQLLWATAHNRVLYSHNVKDFYQLHAQFLVAGKAHAGIALLHQDHSLGDQLRGILGLIATKTAENMQNQLEFLTQYTKL